MRTIYENTNEIENAINFAEHEWIYCLQWIEDDDDNAVDDGTPTIGRGDKAIENIQSVMRNMKSTVVYCAETGKKDFGLLVAQDCVTAIPRWEGYVNRWMRRTGR